MQFEIVLFVTAIIISNRIGYIALKFTNAF